MMGSSESSPSVADVDRTESPPPMDYPLSPDQGNPSWYSKDHISPITHLLFIVWGLALATGHGGDAVGPDSTGGDGGNIDFTGLMSENPPSVLNAENRAIGGRGGNIRMPHEPTGPTIMSKTDKQSISILSG
ncbi:hypothetical protein BS47DRAFT_855012 [Hydnum rufescens UP504]|uniref:Uncharacterized protein n=1 Tax=Hydnum rufescens UP504 TaxID=1448309 RepID=A0A9P6AZ32_9AGAM|nr:hypothetical protein BS47DRAFT_855012 [Hydnum rufescens UP504]